MHSLFNTLIVSPLAGLLRGLRRILDSTPRFYSLLGIATLQPFYERISGWKAWILVNETSQRCPAYRQHLESFGIDPNKNIQFQNLPETSKESYIKRYSLEEISRCGILPNKGVIIDESSGSSGEPTNWIRGENERQAVSKALQLACAMMHGQKRIFVLNCFALGPWATGMNVSMSVADVSWLKSIGPDTKKIDATLREFGSEFGYLLTGYPPFIKRFLDETKSNLKDFDIHLVMGGEGNSEGLRDHFLQHFKSVYSSYGASDLEINMGMETDLTIALRRACVEDAGLNERLFGRRETPMIFQYNPLDYRIETNADGEMLFTVLRRKSLIPKIRYNLHDSGSVASYRDVEKIAGEKLRGASSLESPHLAFPFLFVFGRTDLTIPFFGANIYASDLDRVINDHPELVQFVQSFRMQTFEDTELDRHLLISLEMAGSTKSSHHSLETIHGWIFDGLVEVNQDFREVCKMFTPDRVRVELHPLEAGPFENADVRLKNNYLNSDVPTV